MVYSGKELRYFILRNWAGVTDKYGRTSFIDSNWSKIVDSSTVPNSSVGRQKAWSKTAFIKSWAVIGSKRLSFTGTDYSFNGTVRIKKIGTGRNYDLKVLLVADDGTQIHSSVFSHSNTSIADFNSENELAPEPVARSRSSRLANIDLSAESGRCRIRTSEIDFPSDKNYLLENVDRSIDFGIEVEFQSKIEGAVVCEAFRNAGLPVRDLHWRYGKSSKTKWVLCRDASVGTSGWHGFELTTPVLMGKKGIIELYAYAMVLEKLEREDKIRIRKTCGLHTHLGNFSSGNLEIARAVRDHYSMNESIYDSLVVKSRRLNNNGNFGSQNYCRMIKDCYETDKMQKLTLSKFSMWGTYEIRHHGGTLSFMKMANWVVLNQAVTRKIVDGYVPVQKRTLSSFLNAFVSCEEIVDFFLSRKAILNPSLATTVESE